MAEWKWECHYGFFDPFTTDFIWAQRGVRDSGPTYEVGTLFDCADDLHIGGVLQIVYMGDSQVTCGTCIYSIGSGSQVYGSLLGEFSVSNGDIVDDEYNFSSADKRSLGEHHPDFGGHALGMHP